MPVEFDVVFLIKEKFLRKLPVIFMRNIGPEEE